MTTLREIFGPYCGQCGTPIVPEPGDFWLDPADLAEMREDLRAAEELARRTGHLALAHRLEDWLRLSAPAVVRGADLIVTEERE